MGLSLPKNILFLKNRGRQNCRAKIEGCIPAGTILRKTHCFLPAERGGYNGSRHLFLPVYCGHNRLRSGTQTVTTMVLHPKKTLALGQLYGLSVNLQRASSR